MNTDRQTLRDLLAALDALPTKELINGRFNCNGLHCALGALAAYRGVRLSTSVLLAYDELGIKEDLGNEIVGENDGYEPEPADERWKRMRDWTIRQLERT